MDEENNSVFCRKIRGIMHTEKDQRSWAESMGRILAPLKVRRV